MESLDNDTAELLELVDEDVMDGPVTDIEPLPLGTGTCITSEWLSQKNRLATPLVLLDSELLIRWRNDAFKAFRETEGLEYENRHFYELFSTFAVKETVDKLKSSMKDPSSGFGWNGRVTGRAPGRGHKNLQFVAELNIIPFLYDEKNEPEWYLAVITDVTEREKAIVKANFDSILRASLFKDEDTGAHVERVNSYSRAISEKLKGQWDWVDSDNHMVDNIFVEDIGMFAAYHDVGKIGTPETILQKPGKLNDDEWNVMREHPVNGALILDAHPNSMVKEIARSHHERWDGSGYPFGLVGENIPLVGRIVTIADVYDALRTRRPYKEPFSEKETARIIIEEAGTHFDPDLVEVFKNIRDEFKKIFSENPD